MHSNKKIETSQPACITNKINYHALINNNKQQTNKKQKKTTKKPKKK